MNYNHAYYDAFIKHVGFQKASDNLSGYLSGHHKSPERYFRIAARVQARRGLWVKTFESKEEMRQWVPRVGRVFREAFSKDPDFHPPSDADIAQFSQKLIPIAEPRLIKLVMQGEEVIGYLFAYPDISAGLQKAKGRLWPLGWVHILFEKRRTKWVNLNGLGALPAYQGRGASILLYAELARSMEQFDFEHAKVVQVGEENPKSRSDMEAMGVEWYKRHRSCRRPL